MFLGEFKNSLDNKNRFRIPPKFRKNFDNGMVLTKGNDGCLFLVSTKIFDEILNKMSNLPMFNSEVQNSFRLLFSSAQEIEEDNQGRVLLSNALKNHAKIVKDMVFVGVGNRVEVWAFEKWQDYQCKSNLNFDEIISKLGEYGI